MKEVRFEFSEQFYWCPTTDYGTVPDVNTDSDVVYGNMARLVRIEEVYHRTSHIFAKLRLRAAWLEFLSTYEFVSLIAESYNKSLKLLTPLGRNLDLPFVPTEIKMRIMDIREASNLLSKYKEACKDLLEAIAIVAIEHWGEGEFEKKYVETKLQMNPNVRRTCSLVKRIVRHLGERQIPHRIIVFTPMMLYLEDLISTPFLPHLSLYQCFKEFSEEIGAFSSKLHILLTNSRHQQKAIRDIMGNSGVYLHHGQDILNCRITMETLARRTDFRDIILKLCTPIIVPGMHDPKITFDEATSQDIDVTNPGLPTVFNLITRMTNNKGIHEVFGQTRYNGPEEYEIDYMDTIRLTRIKYKLFDPTNRLIKFERDEKLYPAVDQQTFEFLQALREVL